MKNIFLISTVIFLLLHNNSHAQQMVQTISDTYRLEVNKDEFINKPLKDLLKEIKPEIKTAHVFNNENSSLLLLRFTTIEQQRKKEGSITDRVSLLIYVKQSILWNWAARPKGKELDWTKDDAYKYGNLIISNIEVVTKN